MSPRRRPEDVADPITTYLDEAPLLAQAPFVRALLRAMGIPRQDEDDLIQEIVMGAWRSITNGRLLIHPDVPLEPALRSWLYGITWRQVRHYRERAHRRREMLVAEPFGHERVLFTLYAPAPDGPFAAREILAALDRIPAKYREPLILHHLEGFDAAEIAEILGIPENTARSRIHLGIRAFTRAVQRWRRLRS